MSSRVIFIIFLFLAWSSFCTWYYNCKIKGLCGNNIVAQEQSIENGNKEAAEKKDSEEIASPSTNAPSINKDALEANDPILNIDSVVSSLNDDEKLVIVGKYASHELNNSEFENLGLSRAQELKASFLMKIDSNRIEISSEELTIDSIDMPAVLYAFERKKIEKRKNVIVKDDVTLVYFESNSDQPMLSSEVKSYLDGIGSDLLTDKYKSIRATGYSDNKGSEKNNYYMGLHRAQAIQQYLTSLGCNPNQIELKSYGQYRPVAENDTEAGRAQNRRVEIKLNY